MADHPEDGLVVHEAVRDPAGRPVDLRFAWVNRALERIAGRPVTGLLVKETYGDDAVLLPAMLELVGTGGQAVHEVVFDGDPLDPALRGRTLTAYLTSVGEDLVVAQYRDVSSERRLLQRLEHLAGHDDLTGLPNRRLAVEHLERAMRRLPRSDAGVLVLLGDLDGFKEVNDTHGHAAGDAVLRAVSADLIGAVRAGDVVARWGGDEFLVLCEDVDEPTAAAVADRLEAAVVGQVLPDGTRTAVTLSLGAAWTGLSLEPDGLVRVADRRLYERKATRV
ncbi:hypothetical protein Cma02nite_23650 [Cellulomonas marina]|uniref:Diguanylate cyclase (GGDEF) domain-containing protein n=2 Tax=Cellulomonas marina TaxID=988821 RepID=A0A1I0Y2U6_9CELL|nr:hypothetical protein Cma02nite_23650 [Cellulomonas marina]SFB07641.1 diguanylate cyclase (GGDEF) domain-containing protein [Cellulomonas marina]